MTNASTRYWLLIALIVSVIPQLNRLPWWLDVVLVVAVAWRLPIIEQRLPLPNSAVKGLLLLLGIVGIKSTYRTLFGPEAGTSLLICFVALKLLESKNERDYYIMLTLSFFVLATALLFSQSLFVTLYMAVALLVITSAYVAFNHTISNSYSIRKAFILLAQALPLMLILFIFFPRLPPLWTLNLTQSSGRTGMSDTMAPGDIAKLSQSNELAFRVEFENNKIPPKSSLYWRGLTFSQFDGKTWRPSTHPWLKNNTLVAWSKQPLPRWAESQVRVSKKPPLKYKVILEPTDNVWLYALDVAYSHTPEVGLARDLRLMSQTPVFQRFSYDVLRFEAITLDPDLANWLRQDNVALPASGNPTARKMAQQWRAFYQSDEQYINAVLRWFTKNQFYYTLEPPPLGDNRIDEFLFQTRRGFCEHYASSFTFLLRAAGIPARVVVGYQGGELSPTGDSWQVRQMDAHAWVEAWLPERGWTIFDPTAAVAPERIERGMKEIAQSQTVWGDSALSTMRYGNYKLFGQLRNMADYLNYRWQRDVVGYDSNNQELLLLKLLGDTTLWKRIAVMFGSLMVIAGLLAFWTILKGRRSLHPADKIIDTLSRRLAKRSLGRQQGEGVMAYLERLQQRQEHWQASVKQLMHSYSVLRYQNIAVAEKQELRKMAKTLRSWPSYQAQKTKEL